MTELRTIEQQVESATLRGDALFLDKVYAPDFRFTHGEENGRTLGVQNKGEALKLIRPGVFKSRVLDLLEIEPHGDVAETTGRIHSVRNVEGNRVFEYTVWYVRVYAKRKGHWQLLSHRTEREVEGPL